MWPLDDYFFLKKKSNTHVFMMVLKKIPRHISRASFTIRNKIKQGL